MRDPIHPGETLHEDLEALDMSATELARRIEAPANRITEILNLQKLYELRRAEQKHGAEIAQLPPLDAGRDLHATG